MIEGLSKRIHCAGAGGAGMFPLALYLAWNGHEVTAEDDSLAPEFAAALAESGVRLGSMESAGRDAVLVFSSAVGEDHPARRAADEKGCVALRRGECLALAAKGKRLIAVAGSHGKTSTCSMVVDLLETAGLKPDYLIGAQLEHGLPSAFRDSDWLVAEIDESDGTIELFQPEISLVLNADHDHHARYASSSEYLLAFIRLAQRTSATALVDARLRSAMASVLDSISAKVLWLGAGGDVDWQAKPAGEGWIELSLRGAVEARFTANRTGRTHASNAAFAAIAATAAGFPVPLGSRIRFSAVKRRQSVWYISPELRVFEDYAHHPSELDAVLAHFPLPRQRRTVAVFQPHRYSRTRALKSAFAASLAQADAVILLEVYAASEAPLEGGLSSDLLRELAAVSEVPVVLAESDAALWEWLDREASKGPMDVLFLGAGVGDKLAEAYSKRAAARDPRWGAVNFAVARAGGFHTRLLAGEPLATKTTLRVGGLAERYFEPSSIEELIAALKACRAAGLPVHPIGRGSNLVVPDEGVSGLVLRLGHPCWSGFERLPNGSIRVGAGLRIKTLCGQACQEGVSGFEFLEGIPGSVGGALRMNAGAMGAWIFDVVESVRYATFDGELIEAKRDDFEVGYRYCLELTRGVAVDAVLRAPAEPAESAAIRRKIDTYQEKRRESQPREPSAGCIFKNPPGDSAGRLIEELGLKGAVVGGAEISVVHGNFIINRGGATASDVIELVRFARRVALERRGVALHPEALLFGGSWEETLS